MCLFNVLVDDVLRVWHALRIYLCASSWADDAHFLLKQPAPVLHHRTSSQHGASKKIYDKIYNWSCNKTTQCIIILNGQSSTALRVYFSENVGVKISDTWSSRSREPSWLLKRSTLSEFLCFWKVIPFELNQISTYI